MNYREIRRYVHLMEHDEGYRELVRAKVELLRAISKGGPTRVLDARLEAVNAAIRARLRVGD